MLYNSNTKDHTLTTENLIRSHSFRQLLGFLGIMRRLYSGAHINPKLSTTFIRLGSRKDTWAKKKTNSAQISFSFFFVSLWLCLLLSVLFFILFFIFFGIQGIIVSMNWTQGTLPYISDGVASFIFFFSFHEHVLHFFAPRWSGHKTNNRRR